MDSPNVSIFIGNHFSDTSDTKVSKVLDIPFTSTTFSDKMEKAQTLKNGFRGIFDGFIDTMRTDGIPDSMINDMFVKPQLNTVLKKIRQIRESVALQRQQAVLVANRLGGAEPPKLNW